MDAYHPLTLEETLDQEVQYNEFLILRFSFFTLNFILLHKLLNNCTCRVDVMLSCSAAEIMLLSVSLPFLFFVSFSN